MADTFISEDRVKARLKTWLEDKGWEVEVKWGRTRGTDIFASKKARKWIIEVKGEGSRTQMRLNYFLSILGEILQRMNASGAKYSLALPDLRRYRELWANLPREAKRRIGITIIFVPRRGQPDELSR